MEVITGRELLLFFFPGKPFSLSEPITVGREGLMPKEKERERGNKNRVCCGEDVQNIFISIAKFKRILKKFSIYFAPTTTTTTWTTIRPRLAAKRKSKSRGNNSYHQRGEERDPSLRPHLILRKSPLRRRRKERRGGSGNCFYQIVTKGGEKRGEMKRAPKRMEKRGGRDPVVCRPNGEGGEMAIQRNWPMDY